MNCFSNRNIDNQQVTPPGFDNKKLFPKYKIIKPENSVRYQLKGTRIIISERLLENEYYNYSRKYPWIKVKCFELIQPKEKYICIKIANKTSKNPNKIIIFSNGENLNMCGILPILIDLSSYLKLNIIAFEYPKTNPGQGLLKREQEMLECVFTVISYAYATPEFNSIILMGYSIGVYLNYKVTDLLVNKNKSKKFISKLKSIINISPMWCFDPSYTKRIFHNIKYSNFVSNLIKNTNSKLKISTFISHGVKDNKIGYMISMKISSRLNFRYEWYPKEGDHYNILLKGIFRRKLFKRLQKFLSVEEINIGDEIDNTVISRLTTQGIKVNITKDIDDLNISSGNFFFKSGQNDKNSSKRGGNLKGKYQNSINSINRKESGFSFLDISIQKFINSNEKGNNINEINDEDDEDEKDENLNNNIEIINDIYGENGIEEDNDKNILNIDEIKNNNNYNKDDNIIEVVSSVVSNEEIKNNFMEEDDNKIENKGFLINDSFGCIAPTDKTNEELSFRKDGNQ